MRHVRYDCHLGCPVEATLEVIGGKWKGIILFHLLTERRRFSDFRRLMPEIAQRTLTRQLRDLESEGIISRTIYPVMPPKVEYDLTEYGKTLEPVILACKVWGTQHLQRAPQAADATRQ